MESKTIKKTAVFLIDAENEKREVPRITDEYPDLSVDEAYAIQEELVNIRLGQGYRMVGSKMGLTSHAKKKQMNIDKPIYGYIFDYMVTDANVLHVNELIHPKVEAEIAFILSRDLEGPDVTTEDVLASTEYVVPALEVIDSRFQNFQFTSPDVIADNASSSRVFFGSVMRKPDEMELDLVGVTLSINGELRDLGASAAVLGHPANSVAMLANMLSRQGKKLKAGQIILTGGITGAQLLSLGDIVSAKWDGLGTVEFKVEQ
ncbi:2-keto-4-pentenoate hydratase [Domibacillus epiphyticus]|uniref:4-oxalocrotonate decarboxylase n=1 Tax=Domibacillus epiphyticus TaxID=1714355 RepID=A0A1V2AC70_9BACI|nr:fumarylacetoacetate hydrolase family protein [Domibacillus epiphyticus]OMP68432.1 4-oxalocrotonate decarboxylase [Domibacillus epiphyticus]